MKTNRTKSAKRRTTKRAATKTSAARTVEPDPEETFLRRVQEEKGLSRKARVETKRALRERLSIKGRMVSSPDHRKQMLDKLNKFFDAAAALEASPTILDFRDAVRRLRRQPTWILLEEFRTRLDSTGNRRWQSSWLAYASHGYWVQFFKDRGVAEDVAADLAPYAVAVEYPKVRYETTYSEQELRAANEFNNGRPPKLLRNPLKDTQEWESRLRPHWKSMQYLGPSDRCKGKASEALRMVREVIAPMIGRPLTSKEEERIARSIWATSNKTVGSVAFKVVAVVAGVSDETLRSRLTRTP